MLGIEYIDFIIFHQIEIKQINRRTLTKQIQFRLNISSTHHKHNQLIYTF